MNPLDHPRRLRHYALLVLALVTVVFATACSDDDDNPLADTESVDSSVASESDESAQSGEGDDSDGGSPSDGGAGGEVLGTARASLPTSGSGTVPLRIDVVRLERHGDLVEVSVDLVNEAPEPEGDADPLEYTPSSTFGGGPGINARYDVSDIGLVDGSNQKLYLAIIDSDDVCVCTTGTGAVTIYPGETWTMTATIGGVPDDVEQLDVHVPGFPNVTGLTLR